MNAMRISLRIYKFLVYAVAAIFLVAAVFFIIRHLKSRPVALNESQSALCLNVIQNASIDELYDQVCNFKNSKNINAVFPALKDYVSCILKISPSVSTFNNFSDFIENCGTSRNRTKMLSDLLNDYKSGLADNRFTKIFISSDSETLCPDGKEDPLLVDKCVEYSKLPKSYDNKIISYDSKQVGNVCGNFCSAILKYDGNLSLFLADLKSYFNQNPKLQRNNFENTFWFLLTQRYAHYADIELLKDFCNRHEGVEAAACLDGAGWAAGVYVAESESVFCSSLLDEAKKTTCRYLPIQK